MLRAKAAKSAESAEKSSESAEYLMSAADSAESAQRADSHAESAHAEILGTPYTKRYPLPSIPFTREQPLRESVPKSVHPRERMLTPERISQAHKPHDETHISSSTRVPFSSSRIRL